MRIGVLVDSLDTRLRRGIESAASLDVDCVEVTCGRGMIDPREFGTSARRDLRSFLARKGLALAAVRAGLPGPLTDAEANNRNVPELSACLELARDLGAGTVAVPVGAIPEADDDPRRAAAREALADLEGPAVRHGVLLAARAGTEPAGVLAAFLDAGGLRFVRVAFDPAEFVSGGRDVAESAERLAGRIAHAYARDARRSAGECQVGSGDVPWPEYLAALSGTDYAGPLVVAPPAGPGAREAVARAAEFLRRF